MPTITPYTPVRTNYANAASPTDPSVPAISGPELQARDEALTEAIDAINALGTAADHPASFFDTAGAAAAAQSAAATDATTKANGAQAAAISAAATDATTKAGNAQTAAISAAATDATTKANGAQTAAIAAAATDATTKANAATASALQKASNLSDLGSASAGRTALGLGSAALSAASSFDASGAAAAVLGTSLQKASNLSDVANAATALTNLGGATAAALAALQLSLQGSAVYVEAYGAKGDGKAIADAVITTGTNILTSASAGFTSGDVGKAISLKGAGAAGAELLTTISGFTNSTTVTLTANAGTTIASGGLMVYATDDTTAIKAAVNAAVTAAVASGNQYAEVRFQSKIYGVAGALTQGGTTFGNAQIPLPVITMTAQCVTLCFRGAGNGSALPIWLQTTGQRTGTCLAAMLAGSNDATFGEATVIGGPNHKQGYGSGSNLWNNMCVVVDGISISAPMNPLISGFDFVGTSQAIIKSASFLVNSGITNIVRSSQSWQFGLRMPETNNQSQQIIERFTVEGCCYGLMLGEHDVILALYSFYNLVAIQAVNSTTMPHTTKIVYANCEGDNFVLQSDSGSPFKVNIDCLDIENVSGYGTTRFIADDGNRLRGSVNFTQPTNGGASPLPFGSTQISNATGATQIRITDLDRIPGTVAAPTIPATGAALRNSYWRDADIYITGTSMTDIKINGVVINSAASVTSLLVRVPSGQTITLDYTGTAPTWVWNLA